MKDFWNLLKLKTSVLKDLGFLGSAHIIGTGISAFFWLYIANLLGAEDYGEIQFYLSIAGIAYFVSLFATPHTITVYAAKNVKIHPTLFFISLIGGLLSFIIILSILQRFDVGVLLFGYIINELSLSYLLGKKLYSKYSKNIVIQKILTLTFGLCFYFLFGPEGIIYGLALSYIHLTIIIYKGFKESRISFSSLKPHISFIKNNYLANAINGLRTNIDKIILLPLAGFAMVGNYALAMQFFTILIIPADLVLKYLIPQDSSGMPNPKLKMIIVVISIGIAVFGIIVLPLFIQYLFPEYTDAIEAIQIISISVIPTTVGYLLTSKLLSLEQSKYILFGRIISMSTIIIGFIILIKPFGMTGVAISYVLSTVTQTIFFIFAYKKIMAEIDDKKLSSRDK